MTHVEFIAALRLRSSKLLIEMERLTALLEQQPEADGSVAMASGYQLARLDRPATPKAGRPLAIVTSTTPLANSMHDLADALERRLQERIGWAEGIRAALNAVQRQ